MLNRKCPYSGMPAKPQYTLLGIGYCSEAHYKSAKRKLVLAGSVFAAVVLAVVLL